MRTRLTQEQVYAIIEKHFQEHHSDIELMVFQVSDEGVFEGVLVQHDCEVPIPETDSI